MVFDMQLFGDVMDDDSSMSMLANGSPFATSNNAPTERAPSCVTTSILPSTKLRYRQP